MFNLSFSLESLIIITMIVIVLFLFGFIFTYKLIPKVIQKLKKSEIYGIDVHKISKPKIPEMGGIGVFSSAIIVLIIALIASYFFFQEERLYFLIASY